ncbi:MAG: RND family efflux transporter MFP subunit [Rickettsiales bacterium]|jgi:RND family efflux transporter MFP subunit
MKLSFLILFSLLLSSCDEDPQKQNNQQKPIELPVRVEKPESRLVDQWQEFTGRFQGSQRVEIRARVDGYLEEIKFKDGQEVKKNDVLFVVDPRPFMIALTESQASFDLADSEYNRAKKLLLSKVISQENHDKSLREQRIAETALNNAKLNVEFTKVKAPFDGKISRTLVDRGSLISGGNGNSTLLTTLVQTSPIDLYFEGSETDFLKHVRAKKQLEKSGGSKNCQPVFAKLLDENDFIHQGTVNFLDNELNSDTGTIQMRASFANESGILEAGLFARIRLSWEGPDQKLLVKDSAVGTEQTRKYLYVLDGDNKAFRKYVTLGSLTEDGLRIIENGLLAEDRIVVASLHMVREGSVISPILKEVQKIEEDQKELKNPKRKAEQKKMMIEEELSEPKNKEKTSKKIKEKQ